MEVKYLTRNETILPSSFLNSSLTTLGTLSSLVVSGNTTIGGTLQSPLTSLLGVSIGVIDLYKGTMLSTSMPQYLTRNETIIPVSFNTHYTNDNLKFNAQANSNSYIQFTSNSILDNAFYIGKIGADMVLSTSGAIIFKKYGGVENSRIDTSANWIINNNLTISGTLQSPLTSLLGVSIGTLDLYKGTMLSTSMPQYLTRNETILPSSFINLGTTASEKTINCSSYTQINTDSALNSYLRFGRNGESHTLMGQIGGDNAFIRHKSGTSLFQVENNSGSVIWSVNGSGNVINTGNLTISGTLQSPLTSLLGVSIANLTTNSSIINTTTWGTTATEKYINTNSFVEVNAQDANNSYIRFKNTGNGNYSLFGQIDNDDTFIRLNNSSGIFKIQNSSGVNRMTLDNSGNTSLSGTLSSGAVTASGASQFGNDTNIYNSGGNCSFKIQSSTYTYRYETDTSDNHYLWDGANNEVYHVDSRNNIWFQGDVNCAGTFYDSGVPVSCVK